MGWREPGPPSRSQHGRWKEVDGGPARFRSVALCLGLLVVRLANPFRRRVQSVGPRDGRPGTPPTGRPRFRAGRRVRIERPAGNSGHSYMRLLLLIPVCLFAQTALERADEAFREGNFSRAEALARQAVA